MGRPFDFSKQTRQAAFFRQWNLCAHCGRNLADLFDHAHHVVPNQVGDEESPDDRWLTSEDNCVVLCEQCHDRVHENGRYRDGAVAPPEYYTYSHGRSEAEHKIWLARMNVRFWAPRGK